MITISKTYSYAHNVLELADILRNVYFTTKMKRNYLLIKMLNRVDWNVANRRKTWNSWNYSIVPSFLPKIKILSILARNYRKLDIELLS